MSLADQLITRGWTQGTPYDHRTGRVCLVGGLEAELGCLTQHFNRSVEVQMDLDAAYAILNEVFNQETVWFGDFVAFNDRPSTTFDDVLRLAKQFDEVVDWMKEMKGAG